MKKIVLTIAVAFALINGYSQSVNIALSGNDSSKEVDANNRTYLNDISIRAIRDFSQRFKDINDAEWLKIKDGYSARFTLDSIKTRVDYNLRGNWLTTMKYYDEKKMSRKLRTQVKSRYFDYTIELVIELQTKDKTIYEVHLSDATTLKNIWVSDEEITVIGEYERR